jgi:3D (Asp-Asp-Asp) domain-containing protein
LSAAAADRIVTVTAYCPCKICCGQWAGGKTTSGTVPREGRTIAATRDFRIGQRVVLFGKVYTVEDRMSSRYKSNRVDIFMRDHQQALRFGIKKVKL